MVDLTAWVIRIQFFKKKFGIFIRLSDFNCDKIQNHKC